MNKFLEYNWTIFCQFEQIILEVSATTGDETQPPAVHYSPSWR